MSTLLIAGVCVFVWLSLNALFALALTRLRRRREQARTLRSPGPARARQVPAAGRHSATPLTHAVPSAAAVLGLRGGPAAPARARSAIRPLVDDADAAVVGDLLLLVSELVTNSVVHGGADEATRIGLVVRLDPRTVHVEVANPRRRFARIERGATNGGFVPRATGRGLQLLEALAYRWAVDESDE